MDEKTLPIFLGDGDDRIQIGTALVSDWKDSEHKKILANIDVFVGERLTFSRIIEWQSMVEYSKARYLKG